MSRDLFDVIHMISRMDLWEIEWRILIGRSVSLCMTIAYVKSKFTLSRDTLCAILDLVDAIV